MPNGNCSHKTRLPEMTVLSKNAARESNILLAQSLESERLHKYIGRFEKNRPNDPGLPLIAKVHMQFLLTISQKTSLVSTVTTGFPVTVGGLFSTFN